MPSPVRALSDDPLYVGVDLVDVVEELVEREVQWLQQVDLVATSTSSTGPEHQRILERLVLAFCHRGRP